MTIRSLLGAANDNYRGLLAESPADFRDCANIVSASSRTNRVPYSITNMGLSIELLMIAWAMGTYLAALDCEVENSSNARIGIFLKLLPENSQCARVMVDSVDRPSFDLELIPQNQYRKIFVRQEVWRSLPTLDRVYGFWLRKLPLTVFPRSRSVEHSPSEAISWNQWTSDERIVKIPMGSRGTAGILWFRGKAGYSVLKLGFDTMFNPVCQLAGPLWVPAQKPPKRYVPAQGSFEIKMDYEWMDRRSEYVYKVTKELTKEPRWSNKKDRFLFLEPDYVFKGEWLDRGTDYVFRDRITGLSIKKGRGRVSITEEVIDNRRLWVVDIEAPTGERNPGVTCDGCKFVGSLSLFLLSFPQRSFLPQLATY